MISPNRRRLSGAPTQYMYAACCSLLPLSFKTIQLLTLTPGPIRNQSTSARVCTHEVSLHLKSRMSNLNVVRAHPLLFPLMCPLAHQCSQSDLPLAFRWLVWPVYLLSYVCTAPPVSSVLTYSHRHLPSDPCGSHRDWHRTQWNALILLFLDLLLAQPCVLTPPIAIRSFTCRIDCSRIDHGAPFIQSTFSAFRRSSCAASSHSCLRTADTSVPRQKVAAHR